MATQTKRAAETGGRIGGGERWGRDWRGASGESRVTPPRTGQTGIWIAMASITMFFAALTSAMVVRAGLGADWTRVALPRVLYLNTVVLLASSLTLELSERSLKAGRAARFRAWLFTTAGLGIVFLVGQLDAWRELAARGVYLATNPASTFFYLLTGLHGIHLACGLLALFYLVACHRRIAEGLSGQSTLHVATLYWHFMDLLWIYLLVMLALWA
jgi:cytochrome c oxidase subunit 3